MRHSLPILVLLAGCGWSEERFLVDGLQTYCELASDCVGFEVQACIDYVRAADRSGCDYDGAAARRCARTLPDEGVCQDNGDLRTTSFVPPPICDQVWEGCPLFEPPIDEGTSPPPPETTR